MTLQRVAQHILRNKVLILAVLSATLEALANGASILTATIVIVGLLQRQLAVPADEVTILPVDAVRQMARAHGAVGPEPKKAVEEAGADTRGSQYL